MRTYKEIVKNYILICHQITKLAAPLGDAFLIKIKDFNQEIVLEIVFGKRAASPKRT